MHSWTAFGALDCFSKNTIFIYSYIIYIHGPRFFDGQYNPEGF